VGESKHNTLLRCKVSKDRQHVSALFYKAIIRPDDGLIEKGRNKLSIFWHLTP